MGPGLGSCFHILRGVVNLSLQQSYCAVNFTRSSPQIKRNSSKYIFQRCLPQLLKKQPDCHNCQTKLHTAMDSANALEPEGSVKNKDEILDMTDKGSERSEQVQTSETKEPKPLSKKALKRLARVEKHKEYKRQKKAQALLLLSQKDDVGYSIEDLKDSSYYFENGLRKVYPYHYVFATHAKGRWVGRTIQDVLESEFGFDQPDQLKRAFECGKIHVNSHRVTSNYTLQVNDYISHKTHRHENPVTAAPIEVLADNDDVIVINKPSSIPCHPCGRYRVNSVVFILGKEMGLTNLRNIYRLDRLTSGVLIMAKSAERTKMLMDQVSQRQVQKEYVCRVIGKFPDGTVQVDQPLMALSNKLRLQVVSPKGKPSQTAFTRISYNGKSSVVRCVPYTGRTHQIRVHLQYLGHPIINDVFYNNDAWGPSKGKNGVYEVSFDQVCTRILTEHHRNFWDGGENPLYQQKLRATESSSAVPVDQGQRSTSEQTEGVSPDSQVGEPLQSSQDTGTAADNDSGCLATMTNNEEPPSKRRREGSVSQTSPCSKTPLPKDDNTFCTNPETGEDSVDCSNLKSGAATCQTSQPPDVSARAAAEDCSTRLPGFEISKWNIDPGCQLCKNRLIDPEERNLVMFLHAIKYTGPGWEYVTALPDWAQDDWTREEDYKINYFNIDNL